MKKNKFAEYKTSLFLLLVQIPKILSVIIAHLVCYCTKKLVSTMAIVCGIIFFRQSLFIRLFEHEGYSILRAIQRGSVRRGGLFHPRSV